MGISQIRLALLLAGAAALTLTACAPNSDASPTGTWGDPEERSTPSLVFESDGRYSGTDGCNQVGGTSSLRDGVIELGAMRSTLMYCEGVDTWLIEASTATISGDTMRFANEQGAEIGSLLRRE